MLKTYYQLTKPGIIYGNLLTASAGFLLASKGSVNFKLLLETLIGTALVIAGGCVFNNYLDRGIDAKMARTKKRALVIGTVSTAQALEYGSALTLAGFLVLAYFTNTLTVAIGLTGLFFYVVVYGVGKRKTAQGTLIGSISGATPLVAGYTAVSDRLDAGALLLFLMLVFWQMPHFYAIAIFRANDYKAAGLPVLPIVKGFLQAKIHMVLYILAFTLASIALSVLGYTGYVFAIAVGLLGLLWLYMAFQGFDQGVDDARWARRMFFFSLCIILALTITIPLGTVLP